MSPLVYAGGQWLRLTRAEMLDYGIDPNEGRDDDAPPCPTCGNLPCACGDDEGDAELPSTGSTAHMENEAVVSLHVSGPPVGGSINSAINEENAR